MLATPRPLRPDWAIYTDAASTPPYDLRFTFRGPTLRPPAEFTLLSPRGCYLALPLLVDFPDFWSWALSLGLFMEDWPPFLRRSSCWVYFDDNNCLSALFRGPKHGFHHCFSGPLSEGGATARHLRLAPKGALRDQPFRPSDATPRSSLPTPPIG